MATLAAQITSTGISAPDYADIVAQIESGFWSIYGSDSVLSSDSQDGQMIAIFSQAIYDANQTAIAVYNSYSPTYAQGAGLSSIVKINGLKREVPSNSQTVVTVGGTVGTTITGGIVGDDQNLGTKWDLPPSVTIPISGSIDVTATCEEEGSTPAAPGSLTKILTPTLGWLTVTNAAEASPGNPVELDPALRQRQAASTALPAQTINEGIYSAVAALPGVSLVKLYENPNDPTDANGIPGHSISLVVFGGDVTQIAQTIALKKTPGTGTFGSISELVLDQNGMPITIYFNQLLQVPLQVEVTIKALTGFTSAIGDAVQQAMVDFVGGLSTGESSYLARLYSPANMGGTGDGATFYVTGIRQAIKPNALAAADLPLTYDQLATLALSDVSLVTT